MCCLSDCGYVVRGIDFYLLAFLPAHSGITYRALHRLPLLRLYIVRLKCAWASEDGAPIGVQGQSPWSRCQGRSLSEAESFLAFVYQIEHENLPHCLFLTFYKTQFTQKYLLERDSHAFPLHYAPGPHLLPGPNPHATRCPCCWIVSANISQVQA